MRCSDFCYLVMLVQYWDRTKVQTVHTGACILYGTGYSAAWDGLVSLKYLLKLCLTQVWRRWRLTSPHATDNLKRILAGLTVWMAPATATICTVRLSVSRANISKTKQGRAVVTIKRKSQNLSFRICHQIHDWKLSSVILCISHSRLCETFLKTSDLWDVWLVRLRTYEGEPILTDSKSKGDPAKTLKIWSNSDDRISRYFTKRKLFQCLCMWQCVKPLNGVGYVDGYCLTQMLLLHHNAQKTNANIVVTNNLKQRHRPVRWWPSVGVTRWSTVHHTDNHRISTSIQQATLYVPLNTGWLSG